VRPPEAKRSTSQTTDLNVVTAASRLSPGSLNAISGKTRALVKAQHTNGGSVSAVLLNLLFQA
jgi:hypothetical protein